MTEVWLESDFHINTQNKEICVLAVSSALGLWQGCQDTFLSSVPVVPKIEPGIDVYRVWPGEMLFLEMESVLSTAGC